MSQAAPEFAVETIGLSKTYRGGRRGPVQALVDVSLRIPRGSMFGLLGPNGAGKSTLINILGGLVLKTGGEAKVWGFDIERDMRAARRAIGIVPQELNLDPFFTPREVLEVQAGLYGVASKDRRTDEILAAVGLTAQANAYARSLSGGMRRRLLVGKALVHSPPVLVLDEPTAGVDVELRQQLWTYVRKLNGEGTTVLLTTHYLEEAEELCDNIAIINRGRLVACEPTPKLLARLDSKEMTVLLSEPVADLPPSLAAFHIQRDGDGRKLHVRYTPSQIEGGRILAALFEAGLKVAEVSTHEAELEDIFLHLTRREDAAA
jgi:ABC-2 type transport system ATP-binding protein